MRFIELVGTFVALASATEYNPEAHNLYNERAEALQRRKDRRYTFKGADNEEAAIRAMCKQTWVDRAKILECMNFHGVYPRYYEDKLEKRQNKALELCDNIYSIPQRRKCYRDVTSVTSAGTRFSTQAGPSYFSPRQMAKKERLQSRPLSTRGRAPAAVPMRGPGGVNRRPTGFVGGPGSYPPFKKAAKARRAGAVKRSHKKNKAAAPQKVAAKKIASVAKVATAKAQERAFKTIANLAARMAQKEHSVLATLEPEDE